MLIGSPAIKTLFSILACSCIISEWGDSKLSLTRLELEISLGGQILIRRFDGFGLHGSPKTIWPKFLYFESMTTGEWLYDWGTRVRKVLKGSFITQGLPFKFKHSSCSGGWILACTAIKLFSKSNSLSLKLKNGSILVNLFEWQISSISSGNWNESSCVSPMPERFKNCSLGQFSSFRCWKCSWLDEVIDCKFKQASYDAWFRSLTSWAMLQKRPWIERAFKR